MTCEKTNEKTEVVKNNQTQNSMSREEIEKWLDDAFNNLINPPILKKSKSPSFV